MRSNIRRLLLRPLRRAAASVARTAVAGALLLVCAAAAARWLGYPAPGFSELREYFDGVSRLADLLS